MERKGRKQKGRGKERKEKDGGKRRRKKEKKAERGDLSPLLLGVGGARTQIQPFDSRAEIFLQQYRQSIYPFSASAVNWTQT